MATTVESLTRKEKNALRRYAAGEAAKGNFAASTSALNRVLRCPTRPEGVLALSDDFFRLDDDSDKTPSMSAGRRAHLLELAGIGPDAQTRKVMELSGDGNPSMTEDRRAELMGMAGYGGQPPSSGELALASDDEDPKRNKESSAITSERRKELMGLAGYFI